MVNRFRFLEMALLILGFWTRFSVKKIILFEPDVVGEFIIFRKI